MLLLSVCIYGILQIHCNELNLHQLCFSGNSYSEICHKASRHCTEGRDFPNTTTTSTPPTTTTTDVPTTSTTTSSTTSSPPVDETVVMFKFKYRCLNASTNCEGRFEVISPFTVSLSGGNTFTYLCDDILRMPPGQNAYAHGLRISTLIWKLISNISLQGISPQEATQKWISCPNTRHLIRQILGSNHTPVYSPIRYTCWCFNNLDNICYRYLNAIGPRYSSCYHDSSNRCYFLLCSDGFGNYIDFLTDVDENVTLQSRGLYY